MITNTPLPRSTATATAPLPTIPVLSTGPDFPMATLAAFEPRAHLLFNAATAFVPKPALHLLDTLSRRWLEKWDNAHLAEIDAITARLKRPGAYFLSVNYEWACTCAVVSDPLANRARLVRVLDWATPGLGKYVIAANVAGAAGPFTALTWPGYSGVIQGMAPHRFAAALNQAPMRKVAGLMPIDWAIGRARLWQTPYPTAAHVLRSVFESAASFSEARQRLIEAPIAAPGIFSLTGISADEVCIIERSETQARVFDGPGVTANHWRPIDGGFGGPARSRGIDSPGRAALMPSLDARVSPDFSWLRSPVLNRHTRLAMVADAGTAHLVARGYETDGPATQPLELEPAAARTGSMSAWA